MGTGPLPVLPCLNVPWPIDLESGPFVLAAVVASISLGAALVWRPSRSLLLVTFTVAVVFAVADAREVLAKIEEEASGGTVLATIVATLHVVAAVATAIALRPAPAAGQAAIAP